MLARTAPFMLLFLLAGCAEEARFVITSDLPPNVGVVAYPQTDLCQWYYRNKAISHIKDFQNPDFNEKTDIISEELIDVDMETQQIHQGQSYHPKGGISDRPIVNNGVPFADSVNNRTQKAGKEKKEFVIKYRLPPGAPNVTGVLASAEPLKPAAPPANGILPAGAVQKPPGPPGAMPPPAPLGVPMTGTVAAPVGYPSATYPPPGGYPSAAYPPPGNPSASASPYPSNR